jgi:GGDEF domain-containing protein
MATTTTPQLLTQARYSTLRRWLLLAGIAILLTIIASLIARGVDQIEVIAAVLYVGVYVGGLVAGVVGGAAAGLLAAAVYSVARFDAIDALGASRYGGLLVARLLGYVMFGIVVGLAWQLISERLDKLDAFDDVDDETLLLNARGMVEALDRETSRARRFGTTFSVVTVDVPLDVFNKRSRRHRQAALREFGRLVTQGARSIDETALYRANQARRLAILLPETDAAGADAFMNRLVDRIAAGLLPREISLPRGLQPMAHSFPDGAVELGRMRAELVEIEQRRVAGR